MEHFKEKMIEIQNLRPFTTEEIDIWSLAYQQFQKDIAKEKGADSFLPASFLAELGELITVISESLGRPDKNITKWDILDEMADVSGFLYYMMGHYEISMELLQRAVSLKIVKGACRYHIPLCDMIRETEKESDNVQRTSPDTKTCGIDAIWDEYVKAINH